MDIQEPKLQTYLAASPSTIGGSTHGTFTVKQNEHAAGSNGHRENSLAGVGR